MQANVKPGARIPDWEAALAAENFIPWCFETSGSTMDLGRDLARSLPLESSGLVLTKLQLGGRGRQGRQWVAPKTGFFATYVFSLSGSPEILSGLSLAVGVVLAEALTSLGADLTIKWPNDLLHASGDKLAGILIETASSGGSTSVLIGIGVNLAGEAAGVPEAASIESVTGAAVSPLELAKLLSPLLRRAWREFCVGGFAPFMDRFLAKAAYLNTAITLDHGGKQENGVYRGVDQRGALRLELDGELVTRASGEVKNLRPAHR